MPTSSSADLPPPSSWDEFEVICADLWMEIWADRNAQRYGRTGQRQNGVDIFGRDRDGANCAAQCKGKSNWPPSKLSTAEVDAEIEKAKKFSLPIQEFLILTTAANDVTVQDHVNEINSNPSSGISFRVVVLSWSEIYQRLSSHKTLLEKHYPGNFRKPIPAGIFDREAIRILDELVQSRFFGNTNTEQTATQLSERILENDLIDASSSVRSRCLAWCSRLLSTKHASRAKKLLEQANSIFVCEETKIASAFILASESQIPSALTHLNELGSALARSAALMIKMNDEGLKKSLEWSDAAGLQWEDYENDGRTRLILAASETDDWARLSQYLEKLQFSDEPLPPALASVGGRGSLLLALPQEERKSLDHSPPFFAHDFRFQSTSRADDFRKKALILFQKSASGLREIGLEDAALVQDDFVLWLKLASPSTRREAQSELEAQMDSRALRMRRANLAFQYGVKIDRDQLERDVDQEVARSGGGSVDTGCAALALALSESSPNKVVEAFRKRKSVIVAAISAENVIGMEIELLANAGLGAEARCLQNENEGRLTVGRRDNLERIIQVAEGADPVALLVTQYERDRDLQTLVFLVDALFERESWDVCGEYSAQLFEKTKNLNDGKRYVQALTETGRFADVVVLIDNNPELLSDFELQKVQAWALSESGDLTRCIKAAEHALPLQEDRELRRIYVDALIASGDWDKLPQEIERDWDNRAGLSAREILQTAQMAQITGHAREKDLVRAAVSKSEEDGFAFAGAYFLASKGGWEEDEEVGNWFRRAVALSDENGPMHTADLKEIVEKQVDWNKHSQRIFDTLRSAQCPIFIAATNLNRRLVDFTLSTAEANKDEKRPTFKQVIPSYSGKRQVSQIPSTSLGLEATSLLTLQHIGMLEATLAHFSKIFIPHSTMPWLLEEISDVRFHQPSRIKRADALCHQILEGNISLVDIQRPVPYSLIAEVGEELGTLLVGANFERTKSETSFVVRGFPVSKVGSLGDKSADLRDWEHLLVSTTEIVSFLSRNGLISDAFAENASGYLKLQETGWPEKLTISDGSVLFLDDLTISYLQHLGLLEKLCASSVQVKISKETHANAMALRRHKKHTEKIENELTALRRVINREIISGKILVLPNSRAARDDDEDRQLWSHPTMSVFGTENTPEAIAVDDRFLNRHQRFDQPDVTTSIFSTLDILSTLHHGDRLTKEQYYTALSDLRESGHIFIPLLDDELRFHMNKTKIDSGELVLGRDLRLIKGYYLLGRSSEFLTIPDDTRWLLDSNRVVNEIIKEQWVSGNSSENAEIKSNWLFGLIDLRIWANSEQHIAHGSSVESLWKANIFGLLALPEGASSQQRKSYLTWLDEQIIQPLKLKHPSLFEELVTYSKDLLLSIVTAKGHEEASDE